MSVRPVCVDRFLAFLARRSAHAGEIFGGLLAHDVDTPLTRGGFEDGADVQLGWRGGRIAALRFIGSPSPYVFGSLSTAGDTNFAAAGLSWQIGGGVPQAVAFAAPASASPSTTAPV